SDTARGRLGADRARRWCIGARRAGRERRCARLSEQDARRAQGRAATWHDQGMSDAHPDEAVQWTGELMAQAEAALAAGDIARVNDILYDRVVEKIGRAHV